VAFRWKGRQGVPIPEASRFDRLAAEDLFLLLESGLGNATHLTDLYRATIADEKEAVLAQVQTNLEDALAATKAMRRKLVVTISKER
jgi:hypothetical protein